MITTDVWARGNDVQQVTLVINYDIPNNRELYIGRIGCSGSFVRKGVVINFRKDEDIPILQDIEEYYSTQIEALPANGKNNDLNDDSKSNDKILICKFQLRNGSNYLWTLSFESS